VKSTGLIPVRQMLKPGNGQGHEGASLLFYYLFDDWNATFFLMVEFRRYLAELSTNILGGLDRAHNHEEGTKIIKRLYEIGGQLRTNQHLYEGYKNLIERILEFKPKRLLNMQGAPISGHRITIALSASERFERLGDRIRLIVLSSLSEAISEKDALINTYFSIRQQKDSEATAKLNQSAALLSKLGVLFLPVSLMTSYFSVQIADLQGIYTSTTYWVCFAILMTLSILVLFVFSFWLVAFSNAFDNWTRRCNRWFLVRIHARRNRRRGGGGGAAAAAAGDADLN